MPIKRGSPQEGEFVICEITKVNPNSAYCRLVEYGMEGLIHISEVSGGWVRDIRRFVSEGKEVVAVVIRMQPLALSIKRVRPEASAARIKEWNLEKRAEKILERIAKERGRTLEQAYNEIGFALQERFGTLHSAFKEALAKPEKVKQYAGEWFEAIAAAAEKEIGQKEYELRAKLHISSDAADGIVQIKQALLRVRELGLDVRYIAAPRYLVKYKTKDPKKGQRDFESRLAEAAKLCKDVEFRYEMEK